MHIHKAIKIIGKKAPMLKPAADRSLKDDDHLIKFVEEMLEQYNEPENGHPKSNRKRMNGMFGEDVMQCLVKYAKQVNAWNEIQLTELQSKEGKFNMN